MKKILAVFVLAGVLASCSTPKNHANEQNSKTNSNSTTENMSEKEIVGSFLGAAITNDPATMRNLANEDYIQHNPFLPTGLEPFIRNAIFPFPF